MTRPLNNPAVLKVAEDAYSYKRYTERPRVVTVSRGYWLAALPAVALCVLLLIVTPGV